VSAEILSIFTRQSGLWGGRSPNTWNRWYDWLSFGPRALGEAKLRDGAWGI